MKKYVLALMLLPLVSNAQLKDLLGKASDAVKSKTGTTALSTTDISKGLKEALQKGVEKEVTKLTATDGFYKNEVVKILLPAELQKVDNTLRKMGMSKLADEGIKVLNRAAEEAVKEAVPVFTDAITKMTITDAKNILMGDDRAATSYLEKSSSEALYAKFNPVVVSSLDKVGANKVWAGLIQKYNSLPMVSKVNADLDDYVTSQAMAGVFKMIAVEEKNIRNNLASRTSGLLKKVFALQD